jgi:hypothetical protein
MQNSATHKEKTHTQVLWDKGFRGEALGSFIIKDMAKRHPKDSLLRQLSHALGKVTPFLTVD